MEIEQEQVLQEGDFQEINTEEKLLEAPLEENHEERAKLQGWVPEGEFRGDKAKHISAKEFVDRADHMMPILKGVNRKLETKLTESEKTLAETQETLKRVVSIQDKYSKDAYDEKVIVIGEKKRQAVVDRDTDEYDRLNKKEKDLKPPEPAKIEVKIEEPPKPPPEMQRWFDENKWFTDDAELNQAATNFGEVLAKQNHPLAVPGKEYEFGEFIKTRVQALYPDKFSNPNQQSSEFDAGDTGGTGGEHSAQKGFTDLPKEAQQQCNKLVVDIPGFTKERYINDYFSEE